MPTKQVYTNNQYQHTHIARNLLFHSREKPYWPILPNAIKREMCRLTRWSYKMINEDPCWLYKHFSDVWEKSSTKEDTIKEIDCAICLTTYKMDGKNKTTTLLCGHAFCSKCIFRHLAHNRYSNATCPMCRQEVLRDDTQQVEAQHMENEDELLEKKRKKRRLERYKKHQKKMHGQTALNSVCP